MCHRSVANIFLSNSFCVPSHLFIGLWWPFKNLLNRCDSQELFSIELWLLGVIFWISEFLTWIKLEKRLSLASSKSCIHAFTFSTFLMMTIKWFLFDIIKTRMIHILPLFDDDAHYPRLDLFDIIKIFMIYRENC